MRTQICLKATTKSLQHMMRFQQFLNAKVPHWATPRAVLPPAPSQRSPTRRHGWVLLAEEVLKSELLKDILGAISFLRQVVNSKMWTNNILHTSIYIYISYIYIYFVYICIVSIYKYRGDIRKSSEIIIVLIHHSLENNHHDIHKLRLHPWSLLPDDGSHQLLPLGPAFFSFFGKEAGPMLTAKHNLHLYQNPLWISMCAYDQAKTHQKYSIDMIKLNVETTNGLYVSLILWSGPHMPVYIVYQSLYLTFV